MTTNFWIKTTQIENQEVEAHLARGAKVEIRVKEDENLLLNQPHDNK